MLKIGIDIFSALHSPRGMGIYTINFLKYLAQIDKENQYVLYGDIDDIASVLPKQENFKLKVLPAKGLFHYEQFVLPFECKKDKIDILHSPANTSPIFLDKKIRRFLTLHDIIFLKQEIPFSKNKKQFIGRLYYISTVLLNAPKTEKVFTVSNYSKEDIIKTLGINENKIIVTPNGHEHFEVEKATDIETLKLKYKIPEEYFFHLGGEAPSKNTRFLLEYFVKNQDKNIVVAGIRNLDNSYLYVKYSKYSNIYFVPYILQADLVGLYKNAKAFLFASLYEGFGIPLLEAMKCNCPIISSNASCLPEIAGDTALYFNPRSYSELNNIINKLNEHENFRQNNDIQKQLNKFEWIQSAKTTQKGYLNGSKSC